MKKGILYVSYFANIKNGKGVLIDVSRYKPRWLNLEIKEIKSLAPSNELLFDYKHKKVNWDIYIRRYLEEITNKNPGLKEISDILNSGQDVTIYCHEYGKREKLNGKCHRFILMDIFKALGYNTDEI